MWLELLSLWTTSSILHTALSANIPKQESTFPGQGNARLTVQFAPALTLPGFRSNLKLKFHDMRYAVFFLIQYIFRTNWNVLIPFVFFSRQHTLKWALCRMFCQGLLSKTPQPNPTYAEDLDRYIIKICFFYFRKEASDSHKTTVGQWTILKCIFLKIVVLSHLTQLCYGQNDS